MDEIEEMRSALDDVLAKRRHLFKTVGEPLLEVAKTRALNPDELAQETELEEGLTRFDQAAAQLRAQIEIAEQRATLFGGTRRAQAGEFVRVSDLRPAAVQRDRGLSSHPVAAEAISRAQGRDAAVIGQHGDLGQLVRSMTTTGGSAIVPTTWAGSIIDRARNLSAVMQAGAQLVPMDAKTVQIGRLIGDPAAAFRAESAPITASDPTFDNLTLTATTMNALVIGSAEWFEDATSAAQLVTEALAQAMAAKLDLVALYGGITTGAGAGIDLPHPPNPAGILASLIADAPTSVLGGATNGTEQAAGSFYNELLDLIWTPADHNEAPNALIWNSKAARQYAKAYDTTGQPLQAPADVTNLARFVSNQVPSYKQGTMNTATDVFVGDFTKLLIGQRLELNIQVLNERYADTGEIGIVATWRGDVGVARPRAFAVHKALKGS